MTCGKPSFRSQAVPVNILDRDMRRLSVVLPRFTRSRLIAVIADLGTQLVSIHQRILNSRASEQQDSTLVSLTAVVRKSFALSERGQEKQRNSQLLHRSWMIVYSQSV